MPWMESHYNSRCKQCRKPILEGDRFYWEPSNRESYCDECGDDADEEFRGDRKAHIQAKVSIRPSSYDAKCPECNCSLQIHGPDGCKRCPCLKRFAQPA